MIPILSEGYLRAANIHDMYYFLEQKSDITAIPTKTNSKILFFS